MMRGWSRVAWTGLGSFKVYRQKGTLMRAQRKKITPIMPFPKDKKMWKVSLGSLVLTKASIVSNVREKG